MAKKETFDEALRAINHMDQDQLAELIERAESRKQEADRKTLVEMAQRNRWTMRDISAILTEAGVVKRRGRTAKKE